MPNKRFFSGAESAAIAATEARGAARASAGERDNGENAKKIIFLDTETTGLRPNDGDRIVEIAAVAYAGRAPVDEADGGKFHCYINPERDMPKEAFEVHGISAEQLRDKPKFADIADEFIQFARDGELVIHNASFDEGFLNAELKRAGKPELREFVAKVECSLDWSRQHNREANGHGLDALCRQFGVKAEARAQYHSAIVDARLLGQVFFRMIQQQSEIAMAAGAVAVSASGGAVPVRRATEPEEEAHAAFLAMMKEKGRAPPELDVAGSWMHKG